MDIHYYYAVDDMFLDLQQQRRDQQRRDQRRRRRGYAPGYQCPRNTTAYIIRRGDTFYNIATRFGISLDELLNANPDVNPDDLEFGQQLCIPRLYRR